MKPTPHRYISYAFVLSGALLIALATPQSAKAQILDYQFNTPGAEQRNGDSPTGWLLTTYPYPNTGATDLISASGTGVSGLSGDRALDFRSTYVDGTNSFGPKLEGASYGVLNGMSEFTIAFWVSEATFTAGSRIFSNLSSNLGIELRVYDTNQLVLQVNGSSRPSTTLLNLSSIDPSEWTFIAVTYSAALSSVSFYIGGTEGSLTVDTPAAGLNGGVTGNSTGSVVIGGVAGYQNRQFDGLLDNFQLYGTALTETQLTTLRNSAVAIPEPSTTAFILGAFCVAMLGGRRLLRKRRA